MPKIWNQKRPHTQTVMPKSQQQKPSTLDSSGSIELNIWSVQMVNCLNEQQVYGRPLHGLKELHLAELRIRELQHYIRLWSHTVGFLQLYRILMIQAKDIAKKRQVELLYQNSRSEASNISILVKNVLSLFWSCYSSQDCWPAPCSASPWPASHCIWSKYTRLHPMCWRSLLEWWRRFLSLHRIQKSPTPESKTPVNSR